MISETLSGTKASNQLSITHSAMKDVKVGSVFTSNMMNTSVSVQIQGNSQRSSLGDLLLQVGVELVMEGSCYPFELGANDELLVQVAGDCNGWKRLK